ncbi:PspA/IM30 family protein [Salipiger abyssi]|uniref:PspA/IM30 family protein n=1 Tax=Salipiger abyssi TaxID=1250539 RepID=UPI00405A290B
MFKTLITLVRGQSADTAQAITDANALTILRQQLRDAAHGVESAKRSVAVVITYGEREKKALHRIAQQIEDLEARALDALDKGREDLATEAAAAIAELEAERGNTEKAIATYDAETRRLREEVSLAEQHLRVLQRGKQLADATAKSQRVRGTMPDGVINSLREAEATLERLQDRQGLSEATAVAMADLSATGSAEATSARLAAAGCGAPLRPDAAAVLDRLKQTRT